MFSRISLYTGAFVLALAVAGNASAQRMTANDQAEWGQNYDSASRLRVPRSVTPILSSQTVSATDEMIGRYRDLVARGGWQRLSIATNLRVGSKSGDVTALRQRLFVGGDLDPSVGTSAVYDSYVEAGVRRFQARHGLNTTGQMNAATLQAMNVPADVRLKQLEINVVRLRSYGGNLGNRYVIVNIPAAVVETVESNEVQSRHAAGVGKIDRQSPIMNAKVVEINFNPFWTVPASIIRKDLIPKMRSDPTYLSDNKIRVYNKGGQEVAPQSINWNSMDATQYMFRQDPGGDTNSMGFVRINIPNPYGVYMHDTPAKGVFGDDFRFVSSGCVRLQNVRDYIQFLLKETPGWGRPEIENAFLSGQRKDARLREPVNVYWTYITAWATPDGLVQFRGDIYNRDGLGNQVPLASADPVPPKEEKFFR